MTSDGQMKILSAQVLNHDAQIKLHAFLILKFGFNDQLYTLAALLLEKESLVHIWRDVGGP
jgi:hypothetical protein